MTRMPARSRRFAPPSRGGGRRAALIAGAVTAIALGGSVAALTTGDDAAVAPAALSAIADTAVAPVEAAAAAAAVVAAAPESSRRASSSVELRSGRAVRQIVVDGKPRGRHATATLHVCRARGLAAAPRPGYRPRTLRAERAGIVELRARTDREAARHRSTRDVAARWTRRSAHTEALTTAIRAACDSSASAGSTVVGGPRDGVESRVRRRSAS